MLCSHLVDDLFIHLIRLVGKNLDKIINKEQKKTLKMRQSAASLTLIIIRTNSIYCFIGSLKIYRKFMSIISRHFVIFRIARISKSMISFVCFNCQFFIE